MTNEQIIGYSITAFTATVLAPFSNMLFRKYIEPKMPDMKKLISYTKNALFFILRYILPIYDVADKMIDPKVVLDKYFVFNVCFFMGLLFFNVCLDVIAAVKRLQEKHLDIHYEFLNRLVNWQEKSISHAGKSNEIDIIIAEEVSDVVSVIKELMSIVKELSERIVALEKAK